MKIKAVLLHKDSRYPEYATKGSSGADVFARLPGMGLSLESGQSALVPSGIAVELPEGFEIQIRSRSGLAAEGIVVLNSPGTVDSDYRGEIMVLLYNFGPRSLFLKNGDRIAQLVLARSEQIEFSSEGELTLTKRGKKGFGSSGK